MVRALFSTILLVPSVALPCSVVPPAQTAVIPPDGSVVGSTPLLVSPSPTATLVDANDTPIALQAADVPLLAGARGSGNSELTIFTPVSPLAPEAYRFQYDEVEISFHVDPSASSPVPAVGSQPELSLHVYDGSADSSGCTTTVSTCGELDSLSIDLYGLEPKGSAYLVTFHASEERTARRLVSEVYGHDHPRLLFYNGLDEIGAFGDDEICIEIAGVASDGTIGAPVDLGCINPEDTHDPRVTRDELGGCDASGGPPALWALLGLVGVLRRRSRRATLRPRTCRSRWR